MKKLFAIAAAVLMSLGSMSAQIWYLSDASENGIRLVRPAIIDFYASWCGPCRQLSPMLERMSKEYEGKVDFFKIDTDSYNDWFRTVGEGYIPFVLFLADYSDISGKVTSYGNSGLPAEANLRGAIDGVLSDWNLKHANDYTAANAEYVDLGLSVNWATCNIGAGSPEQYGAYYAWGETEQKNFYARASYKWFEGDFDIYGDAASAGSYKVKKYTVNGNSAYDGQSDKLGRLEESDDIASIKLGAKWHTPTIAQWKELIEKCSWEETYSGSVKGWKVTGPSGKSIFLPDGGCQQLINLSGRGATGMYWTSEIAKTSPRGSSAAVYFGADGKVIKSDSPRFIGCPIRPVMDKKLVNLPFKNPFK